VLWSLFVSRTTESPLCGCCAAAAIVPALVSAIADAALATSAFMSVFMSAAYEEPFRDPVDWKAWGLFDYPKLIKFPMDLGTVNVCFRMMLHRDARSSYLLLLLLLQQKITRNAYNSTSEYAKDMRQIWKNCQTYNQV
jgi:hypothetical protein